MAPTPQRAPVVALVAAMDEGRVIGRDNALPWHLPADLRRFKSLTQGKPVVMGRKTFESIGRPLPGRTNIVVSGRRGYAAPGCTTASDLGQALRLAADAPGGEHEVMIIGGTSLFAAGLGLAQRMYLTLVHHRFEGDVRFPAYDAAAWREVRRRDFAADEKNPFPYTFIDLERAA